MGFSNSFSSIFTNLGLNHNFNHMSVKYIFLLAFLFPFVLSCNTETTKVESNNESIDETKSDLNMNAELLRHVVLIKFKEGSSQEDIAKVEEAFSSLEDKIPEIKDYEWGINNSPEGINKGFTHCFFVTFETEADREVYLPHPDHKAFVEVLSPHMEDVLVIDYWTK